MIRVFNKILNKSADISDESLGLWEKNGYSVIGGKKAVKKEVKKDSLVEKVVKKAKRK